LLKSRGNFLFYIMIKAGVGLGQNLGDHKSASHDAGKMALSELGGANPLIVFAFSSIKYDMNVVLSGLRDIFPDARIVGGSAAGEITPSSTVFDGVGVMAISSDTMECVLGLGERVFENSFEAGVRMAEDVVKNNGGKKPSILIMIPDGITGNGADIVEGAKSILGENFPIIGGSSGDDYLFEKTYEYYDDKVLSDAVVGIGLTGNFSYGFGVRHGWEPIGLPLTVTKADGVLLQEIDGKPALSVYEEYFGKEAEELVKEPLARMAYTYPLGIAVEDSDEFLIRDPVRANKKGEITVAAAIPEGTIVRLMIGDRDRAIDASKWAGETAKKQLEGKTPRCILMFNCMARNRLLGIRCSEENQIVQNAIGADVPMLGLYTYGEQGPLLGRKGTPTYFHNETMTILVLGDD
jgi:hypothetical protein